MRWNSQRGSSAVEFALILLPFFGLILGIFEVSRAFWTYLTLTTSLKQSIRAISVHGADCLQTSAGCGMTVGQVVQDVARNVPGVDAAQLNLSLTSGAGIVQCSPATGCLSNTAQWPPEAHNLRGQAITLSATYTFTSVMIWSVPGGIRLSAQARGAMEF